MNISVEDFLKSEGITSVEWKGNDYDTLDKDKFYELMMSFAKLYASTQLKSFCESVMHPDSDLHKDADEWIEDMQIQTKL